MMSIQELGLRKQEISELSDLPIEDFVGWDGWEILIDSHIETSKRAEWLTEQKHRDNEAIEKKDDEIISLQEKIERYEKALIAINEYIPKSYEKDVHNLKTIANNAL